MNEWAGPVTTLAFDRSTFFLFCRFLYFLELFLISLPFFGRTNHVTPAQQPSNNHPWVDPPLP